jgi:hypothetical protein
MLMQHFNENDSVLMRYVISNRDINFLMQDFQIIFISFTMNYGQYNDYTRIRF